MGRPAVNIPPVTPKPTDDEQTAFGSVPAREAQVSLASGAADFPKGCLVFIRNVHPETNRTTLKALLGQAFGDQRSNNEFDYVDYNKGMDSCHVRLSNPLYTRTVVQFFTEKPVVQEGGLDDRGTKLSRHGGASSDREPSRKPIQVEAVDGRKEEIYWEKVPEKVRRAALDRMASRSASVVGDTAGPSDNARSRKRRRKG
ncbi:hypothetical protein FRB99_004041 [Tulasnella sp. 403]|nr:hypothetical protein FRB99_004041 [Tulasnella sp. 403]